MTVGVVRVEEELSQLTNDLDTTLRQVSVHIHTHTHFAFSFS